MPKMNLNLPREIDLLFVPADQIVLASIVELEPKICDMGMGKKWWEDPAVIPVNPLAMPIDLTWRWKKTAQEIEREESGGVAVAIIQGKSVQGAMWFAKDPMESRLEADKNCIEIFALATAPRNRPEMRKDGGFWLQGVGTQLLRFAVEFSIMVGCGGRIRVDSSPQSTKWHSNRGFLPIGIGTRNFSGVEYLPMELTTESAAKLIATAPKAESNEIHNAVKAEDMGAAGPTGGHGVVPKTE